MSMNSWRALVSDLMPSISSLRSLRKGRLNRTETVVTGILSLPTTDSFTFLYASSKEKVKMFLRFEPFSKISDWSSSFKNLYLKPVRYFTHRSRTSARLASIVKVSRCSAIGLEAPCTAYNGGEQVVPGGAPPERPCIGPCARCRRQVALNGERSVR